MLFISHSSEDAALAQQLAHRLREADVRVWIDVDNLLPGDAWMATIERVVAHEASSFLICVGRRGVRSFVDLEVRTAISRWAQDASGFFRIIPVLGPGAEPRKLPEFLRHFQYVDARPGLNDASINQLRSLLGAAQPARGPLLAANKAPYLGLQVFDSEHVELFFGRDNEINELLKLMVRDRFVAIVGDSGSGKSSLVRAGLLPALHRGRYSQGHADDRTWRIAILRPGSDPLDGVVRGLLQLAPELGPHQAPVVQAAWRAQLPKGSERLADCILSLLGKGDRALIVVDQLEEVFAKDVKAERRKWLFDSLLATTSQRGDEEIHVLVTLRYDFLPQCFERPDLWKRMQQNQLALRRLPPLRLRDVIRKPLLLAGLDIEDSLVEALVSAAGEEPGHLALLEFTLHELWSARAGSRLNHGDYEAVGRLEGALDRYARSVYEGLLSEEVRTQARRALVKLTHIEGARDTRRRLRKEVLLSELGGGEAAEEAIDTLVRSRLLTASQDWLEISHEALIRHWKQLISWLDEGRDRERITRRLTPAVQSWEAHGDDYVLQGGQLAEVEEWFRREGAELPAAHVRFLQASIAARDLRDAGKRESAEKLASTREKLARLSHARTLSSLERRAGELWPARMAHFQAYKTWLVEAQHLLARLPEHHRTLAEIRSRGTMVGEEWHFDDEQDAWWHDCQVELVSRMESFADPMTGVIAGLSARHGPGIERRLSTARTIEDLTVRGQEALRLWEHALASIADLQQCPLYRGLRIQPQVGLVPIGDKPNPFSGLWEFALPETGQVPVREPATGRYHITAQSSLLLVLLPGGTFWMGAQAKDDRGRNYDPLADPDEGPPHEVTLAPFFLSPFQVTQAQWTRIMGKNPSTWSAENQPGLVDLRHPTEQVSWHDCIEFARRLELLLPTEAQWEFACRAGSDAPFHHGHELTELAQFANVRDRSYARTFRNAGECEAFDDGHGQHAPVGSYQPNAFGLHDAHGNVWEWCRDGYASYDLWVREEDGERIVSGAQFRVARGGSFRNPASAARSASRSNAEPSYRYDGLGFRPARRIITG